MYDNVNYVYRIGNIMFTSMKLKKCYVWLRLWMIM